MNTLWSLEYTQRGRVTKTLWHTGATADSFCFCFFVLAAQPVLSPSRQLSTLFSPLFLFHPDAQGQTLAFATRSGWKQMECKAAGVSVTITQGQELKTLDEVKRRTERHGCSFTHSPHNFPPVHLLDSISSLFLNLGKEWFFFHYFFLFFGEEAALPWSFPALHHTLFAPNPAERIQTWLCANPLKTFKAVGANPSVPAASPWHPSSLVSELTLRVCSHEMWRLPPDQWSCSPRPPPFRLTDIWQVKHWKLFCRLIGGARATLPIQLISTHLQTPLTAWEAQQLAADFLLQPQVPL